MKDGKKSEKKVEEEKDIIRLSTEEKINFAKKGL